MSLLAWTLFGWEWLAPGWFGIAALWLVLAAARLARPSRAALFAPAPLLGADRGPAPFPRSWRVRLRLLPEVLASSAVLLVLAAAARPALRIETPLERRGLDLVLCLDLSSSMAASDLDPLRTRLAVAKAAAERFTAGRLDDRIGLIGFARYPDLVAPPTHDHEALLTLLRTLELQDVESPEDLTGIGTCLARAAEVLRESPSPSRVVVLWTDGEETVADPALAGTEITPLEAARVCESFGVRVYTIAAGVGQPKRGGGWEALDTSALRRIAEITGGAFFEARDAAAVEAVFARIDALETVVYTEPRSLHLDRFVPLLASAALLALAAAALRRTLFEALP